MNRIEGFHPLRPPVVEIIVGMRVEAIATIVTQYRRTRRRRTRRTRRRRRKRTQEERLWGRRTKEVRLLVVVVPTRLLPV